MEQRTLGQTGLSVSILGFGASPLGDEFRKTTETERQQAVDTAIDQGINFFDVSPYYGRTLAEERLGKALGNKRDKIVLATKCGRYDTAGFDFSAERVTRSVDESLQRLRTDRIDVMQVHDIEFGDLQQVIDETIPALRKVKEAGKIRHIGITALSLTAMTPDERSSVPKAMMLEAAPRSDGVSSVACAKSSARVIPSRMSRSIISQFFPPLVTRTLRGAKPSSLKTSR